jgi:hypothetical protein
LSMLGKDFTNSTNRSVNSFNTIPGNRWRQWYIVSQSSISKASKSVDREMHLIQQRMDSLSPSLSPSESYFTIGSKRTSISSSSSRQQHIRAFSNKTPSVPLPPASIYGQGQSNSLAHAKLVEKRRKYWKKRKATVRMEPVIGHLEKNACPTTDTMMPALHSLVSLQTSMSHSSTQNNMTEYVLSNSSSNNPSIDHYVTSKKRSFPAVIASGSSATTTLRS